MATLHKSKIRELLDICIANNILKPQAEEAQKEYSELMNNDEKVPYFLFRCPKCKNVFDKYPPGHWDSINNSDLVRCPTCNIDILIHLDVVGDILQAKLHPKTDLDLCLAYHKSIGMDTNIVQEQDLISVEVSDHEKSFMVVIPFLKNGTWYRMKKPGETR